jgi:hypothetical protein
MKRPLLQRVLWAGQAFVPICLCVVLVFAALAIRGVAGQMDLISRDLDALVVHVDSNQHDIAVLSNRILISAQKTADQAAVFTKEQRIQLKKTGEDSDKTVKALRIVIDRAGLLMKHSDEELATNSQALQVTIAKLGASADGLTQATGTLNARLGDPEITQLLGHLNAISGNLETISGDGAAMAGDMKLAVHRMAQPPTKFHEFLNASWTAAKFGSLFIP